MTAKRSAGPLPTRLRDKGWSIKDAAQFLGVSRQRLYTVFEDPDRARLWECAIAGIPDCSDEIKATLKAERDRKPRLQPRVRIVGPEFEVGDEVMATKHAGIGDEGETGVIVSIRGNKATLQLLVRMADGEDWFPRKDFHEFFATTGVNRKQ
ncbi:hypothetical protein [Hydrogenophaga defluvii]|uniref:Uncharacterized protein n=1 Tax=Hydrogenophaga defluvii TaxID=249410 RepID=A0ABW2SFL9_9BURK